MSSMPTIRTLIRNQGIIELNTNRPDDIPVITARRWVPGESDAKLSCALIFMHEPTKPIAGMGGALQDRRLMIGFQCVAGSNYKEFTDDLLEPSLAWATKVIAGSTFADMATEVIENETIWEQARMDKFYLSATLSFYIRYQTVRDDISATE